MSPEPTAMSGPREILPGAVGGLPEASHDPRDPSLARANFKTLALLLGLVSLVIGLTYLGRVAIFGVLFHR